jgi:hypothetical protein
MSSVVAAVSVATVSANAGGTPAATAEDSRPRKLFRGWLGQGRWSVSEKAPLQNQFSERMCIWRPSVEKQRRQRCLRIRSDERVLIIVTIGFGEFRIVASPALCRGRSNRAQNFAALRSSRRLFLFCRLGMKRAPDSHRVCLCCERGEGTMI